VASQLPPAAVHADGRTEARGDPGLWPVGAVRARFPSSAEGSVASLDASLVDSMPSAVAGYVCPVPGGPGQAAVLGFPVTARG
jgi:hypothetical protein